MGAVTYLLVAVVATLVGFYGPVLQRAATVFGVFRTPVNTPVDAANIVFIDDTVHCEDLHHHLPSGLIFTACEDNPDVRFSWFPPLAHLSTPEAVTKSRGSLHVIDPTTFKSKRLRFENYDGPFSTHGIDVITDPQKGDAVYIYAVNHLPHPQYLAHILNPEDEDSQDPGNQPKARSQIEIFRYVLGADTVRHIRSVWHPLIRTPNDIVATSPTTFYVTNDHYYAEGLGRQVEDVLPGARWSDTVFIQIEGGEVLRPTTNFIASISASVALTGLQNNNGLGKGRTEGEVAIGCAVTGGLHLGKITADNKIEVIDSVGVDSAIDNPTYYVDPYPGQGGDKSGFVLGGMSRAINLPNTASDPMGIDPVMVWMVRPQGDAAGKPVSWTKELLFEDDGHRLRTASAAVLVGIDPKLEGGEKKAWLFASGFISKNVIAVKIPL